MMLKFFFKDNRENIAQIEYMIRDKTDVKKND